MSKYEINIAGFVEIQDLINTTKEFLGCGNLNINFTFNSRFTKTMGIAKYSGVGINMVYGKIELSIPLWEKATEHEKYITIIHEVCHICNIYLNGISHVRHGHDYNWSTLMINCGLKPDRFHNIRLKEKVKNCVCIACHTEYSAGPTQIKRIKNQGLIYRCPKCKNKIVAI